MTRDLMERINNAVDGLCPCGAPPSEESVYCSDDCRPTHISDDTDIREAGTLATPMRWRPDLVTAADDEGLIPMCDPIHLGRFTRRIYERDNTDSAHLRLDDGYRFVGCDVERRGGGEEFAQQCHDAWRRLERELVNPRHTEPVDDDPRADVLTDQARVVMLDLLTHPLDTLFAQTLSYHTCRFTPLVNARQAEVLRAAGMQERRDFLVYFDESRAFAGQVPRPDPDRSRMEHALHARRNRNTGPVPDRLDGRRRRR